MKKTEEKAAEKPTMEESIAAIQKLGGQGHPDLSDPKTLQKILGEAVLRDTLEERGPEGEKLFYAPDSKSPFTGWAKRMHDNGKVKTLGHTKNGKPEGPNTAWHDNGEKEQEGTYKDGKQEGLMTLWHDNGAKKQEVTFKDGEPEGLVTGWHDNGRLAGEVTYKDGKQEGSYTRWHDNGQKEAEGTYKDGEPEGLVTAWDENGKVVLQAHFKNGKRFIEGESDLDDPKSLEEIIGKAVKWDTLKQVGLLYHDARNPEPYTGWTKKFHDNGKLAALGMLKNGKPDGLWTLWSDDGRKAEEVRY